MIFSIFQRTVVSILSTYQTAMNNNIGSTLMVKKKIKVPSRDSHEHDQNKIGSKLSSYVKDTANCRKLSHSLVNQSSLFLLWDLKFSSIATIYFYCCLYQTCFFLISAIFLIRGKEGNLITRFLQNFLLKRNEGELIILSIR